MLLAKSMLALLFTLAPLFISMTLYKQTQRLFDRWLGAILGFALFLVMIPAALVITMNFMDWAIGGTYTSRAVNVSAMSWVPVMFAGALNFVMIKCVAQYAKLIGLSISTMGQALFSHRIGAAISSHAVHFKENRQSLRMTGK